MSADLLPQSYYTTQGPISAPGSYAYLFEGLPGDIASLANVVRNVMVHIFWAERYGLKLTQERQQEVGLRKVELQLQRLMQLDEAPLTVQRPLEKKLVGNCRDHTTLLVAMLRHQGIPARARCGFGTYFIPDHFEDHWVAEYWNAQQGRWVLVDAQIDQLMQDALKLDFDPLDTPRDRFIVAGQAWQMCRAGKASPDDFGIFDMKGLAFVRGNVVRDFLAFNKVEILPWDGGWGVLSKRDFEMTEADWEYALFDRIAELTTGGDECFAEIRGLYEKEEKLRFPLA